MMRFVTNVDPERFDAFAIPNQLNHYSKTSLFPKFKEPEYYAHDLIGVENEEGELIATAVMLHQKTKMPIGQFSYCQYGFNLDPEDKELLRFFMKELRTFAKKKGSFFLRIDPNITRLEHDKNGLVVEGGFSHEYVTDLFKEEGYTHLGYNYGYSGNWMSRYTYCLDLNRPFDQIKKGIKKYNYQTSRNETRTVFVHKAGKEELSVLVECEKELSDKLGFKPQPLSYFEKLWDCYEGHVHYYVCTANYHQAKVNLMLQREEEQRHKALLKDEKKIALCEKTIIALNKEIEEIEQSGLDVDQTINIGAKFIIMMGDKVWNVNMYTKKTLMNFRAAFALHAYAIEDLHALGAHSYDFEGISGSLDPKDEYHGQQDFKKSFGGDFLEFLGEFDAILSPRRYKIFKRARWFYSHARRRIRYWFYKK